MDKTTMKYVFGDIQYINSREMHEAIAIEWLGNPRQPDATKILARASVKAGHIADRVIAEWELLTHPGFDRNELVAAFVEIRDDTSDYRILNRS